MNRILGVLAVGLLACGGPNGNDPVRYGTVRIAIEGLTAGPALDALRDGVEGMSAVGPTVTTSGSAAPGGTIEASSSDFGVGANCVARYDLPNRRAQLSLGCTMLTPANVRVVAAHVAGHLLGMEHAARALVMAGCATQPGATAGTFSDCGHGSGDAPNDGDIAEFRRAHP